MRQSNKPNGLGFHGFFRCTGAQRALNTAKRQHKREPRNRGVLDSAVQSLRGGATTRGQLG